mmetsp:Transcript_62285/g.148688  ORF Transcript_62285/g.148688 Transcript_62285/m.148688 type:complete len:212 (+) Transcript_62285:1254-1889(+)
MKKSHAELLQCIEGNDSTEDGQGGCHNTPCGSTNIRVGPIGQVEQTHCHCHHADHCQRQRDSDSRFFFVEGWPMAMPMLFPSKGAFHHRFILLLFRLAPGLRASLLLGFRRLLASFWTFPTTFTFLLLTCRRLCFLWSGGLFLCRRCWLYRLWLFRLSQSSQLLRCNEHRFLGAVQSCIGLQQVCMQLTRVNTVSSNAIIHSACFLAHGAK